MLVKLIREKTAIFNCCQFDFSSWRGRHWQLAFQSNISQSKVDELSVFQVSRCLTRTFIIPKNTTTIILSTGDYNMQTNHGMWVVRGACETFLPASWFIIYNIV